MMILSHSPTTQAINKALLVARQACSQVRPKEAVNPHFKNKFMPLAEVLRITDAPLIKAGVLMLQAQGRETERPEYVAVETMLVHATTGEYYSATMSMLPKNEGCQEALSCATYMKRSCLASMMGLSLWGEDDDAENATDPVEAYEAHRSPKTAPAGYLEFVAGIFKAETSEEAYDVYLETQTNDFTNWLKHDESLLDLATSLKDEGSRRRATLNPDTELPPSLPIEKKVPAKKRKKHASKDS